MGNQQAIKLGYYEDSDSGIFDTYQSFIDSSPRSSISIINPLKVDTLNSNEDLDEQSIIRIDSKNNLTSTPKKIEKNVLPEFKLNIDDESSGELNDNLASSDNEDDLTSLKSLTRPNYLLKSKSIGIGINQQSSNLLISSSLNQTSPSSNLTSEEDEGDSGYFNSIKNSNDSIYSSTWSPKSSNHLEIKHSKSFVIESPKQEKKLLLNKSNSAETTPESSNSYSFSLRKGMEYFGRVARGVKHFYNGINPATLTGAIDVVVVEQEDGSFRCSPFHVRFGKLGVIRSKEMKVDIEINGQPSDLHMELGEAGEAYFVEEASDSEDESSSCESIPNSLRSSKTTSDLKNASNKSTTSSSIKSVQTIDNLMKKESFNESTLIDETKKENNDSKLIMNNTQPIPIKNEKCTSTPLAIPQSTDSISPSSPTTTNESMSSHSNSLLGPSLHIDKSNNNLAESNTIKIPNFFSDGEITPELTSPAVSRPPTPKSDTELEVVNMSKIKRNSISQTDNANQWSWNWGQLPERQNSLSKQASSETKAKLAAELKKANKESTGSSSSSSGLFNVFNLIGGSSATTSNTLASKSPKEVYLDEVTDKLDSEVADIYINQKSNNQPKLNVQTTTNQQKTNSGKVDDDQESGNGQSLPQSPRDFYSILGDVQISLCGFISTAGNSSNLPSPSIVPSQSSILNTSRHNLNQIENNSNTLTVPSIQTQNISPSTSSTSLLQISPSTQSSLSGPSSPMSYDLSPLYSSNQIQLQLPQASNQIDQSTVQFEDLFQQYTISFEKFVEEIATITQNPNLVIKINNRYMNWTSASPIILSAIVYHRQLTNDQINSVLETNMPKSNKQVQQSLAQQQQQTAQTVPITSNSKFKYFWWPKKSSNSTTQPVNSLATSSSSTNLSTKTTTTTTTVISTTTTTVETNKKLNDKSNQNKTNNASNSNNYDYGLMMDEDLLNQAPILKSKDQDDESDSTLLDDQMNKPKNSVERPSSLTNDNFYIKKNTLQQQSKKQKYKKTTRLSSELIKKLNLLPGPNEIKYSVTTALQGTTRITSFIFLWNYDDKLIVSDIDGTITKSDVLGQVLPLFGRDWTQTGVAELFIAIQRNQYKFIYLSARAIGQSQVTRNLLKNINQDGFTLPNGPLLVTPTSLFQAFQKEVIEKKPEEFKISCLKDIQSLFPENNNPYYAGYGNKTSDVTAYKAVGIPESRIFTINPQGEVKHQVSRAFQSSYSKLCDYVDLMFPPFKASKAIIKAEYDSFNYWRSNVLADTNIIDEIEEEMKKNLANSKETKDAKDRKLKAQSSNLSIS